jgi:Phosphodiester glycosidase
MAGARGRIRKFWAVPAAVLLVLGFAAPARPEAAQAEPALAHALLTPSFAGKASRMHRFRMRLAEIRAEVQDLGFTTPVIDGLGNATLAINGGYWEWHMAKPRMIGWVVSNGTQLSPLRKQLEGVLIVQQARARIARVAGLAPKPQGVELAVQCRPRLVEAGKVIPGLSTEGRAARTAVCIRDAGHTLDAYLSEPRDRGPTLDELGEWLAAEGCSDALNLDGGPSTAAAFRNADGVLKIGAGVGLPYAIRFAPR